MQTVRCVSCARVHATDALDPRCERCGSAVVLVDRGLPDVSRSQLDALPPGVWRFREFLPPVGVESIITLGEGGSPLLRARRLGEELGLRNLFIKDESRNPTGSFLDRGSTVLVSMAKERGVRECACVTTGNLGASLAAYCAKAGMVARIRVHPDADRGKLYQMLAYGAEVESSTAPRTGMVGGALSVTAGNPYLIEGEKTTGLEMVQDLGWAVPDVIAVPVGTGGHLSTIWRSVSLLMEMGLAPRSMCRLLGVEVRAQAPVVGGRVKRRAVAGRGEPMLADLEESVPYFAREADRAVSDSGGAKLTATPAQTVEATRLLASTEGIFAEPSSASVVAAVQDAVRRGLVARSETVVCVITGAGLKDTKAVSRLARETRRGGAGDVYALPSPKIGGTKLALMRILKERPSYGYELWLELGGRSKISTASIYQHLSELEGFSMVRKSGTAMSKGRERVIYELTRRGADFLRIAGRLDAVEQG